MKRILIYNGRLIDPSQNIDETGSLLIADGRIIQRGEIAPQPDYEIIDAEGLVVCPGFIDLHCHLRQPGYEDKETIASGTAAAAKGGFTTVCCMPNTKPPLDSISALDYVKKEAEAHGAVRVLPIGCVTIGRKGEALADLVGLAGAGAIGFSDDGSEVKTAKLMNEALELCRGIGVPVMDHCEDSSMTQGAQINDGEISRALNLKGWHPYAEERIVARDIEQAERTGGHIHICHVSTAGSAELVRQAKKKGVNITAEVTPHHLTLTDAEAIGYNTNAKVNPPLRTRQDCDALALALHDGVIDVIATDHAPHTAKDKDCDFLHAASGISIFETALGSLIPLVNERKLSLKTLISRLTSDPARILKRKDIGTLEVGAAADITIFDPQQAWVVDTSKFLSKGRNTPLNGRMLRGKVMATIYGGRIVYRGEGLKGINGQSLSQLRLE